MAVSLALQTALVALAMLAPLLRVAVLERPDTSRIWLPPQVFHKTAEVDVKPSSTPTHALRPVFSLPGLSSPRAVPRTIALVADAPEIGTTAASGPGAPPTEFGFSSLAAVQPPSRLPAAPKASQPGSGPVAVSSGVESAKLLFGPKPAYPPLAKAARAQGTVRIQAIIGRDGAIRNLQVLSGPPLLVRAALEAVEQWRYRPTMLSNAAVEVITEIDVNFTMAP